MRRLRDLLGLVLLASAPQGCLLFTDPINSPPEVKQIVASATIHPNQLVTFEAMVADADGDVPTLRWAVVKKACKDVLPADWAAGIVSQDRKLRLQIKGHEPSCIRVVARDDVGAETIAAPFEVVPVNREPAVTLSLVPAGAGPFPLYGAFRFEAAPVRDLDDDALTFTWKATDAAGGEVKLGPCGLPERPEVRCLLAEVPGTYTVTVEASDGIARPVARTLALPVLPDQPPCIETTDPSAETGVVVLAVTDPPRRFEVRQVKDDGHPYPAGPRGATTFQWFTAREGSTVWSREVGYDRATFDVGASRFDDARPGTVYRVRVEARDPERELPAALQELAAACEDRAICKVPSTCVRWLTWSVRFR